MSTLASYDGNKALLKTMLEATKAVTVEFTTPEQLKIILTDSIDIGAAPFVEMTSSTGGTVTLTICTIQCSFDT